VSVERAGRRLRWPLVVLLLLLAFQGIRALSIIGRGDECPYDDTFITLRYARNLVEGNGLVFNLGERVEGFSCFLWAMINAAAMALGLNGPIFSVGASILLGLGGIALCFWAGGRFEATDGWTKALGRLFCCWIVLAPPVVAGWATSGMEIQLYALLLIPGVVLLYEDWVKKERVSPLTGALFALLILTRPEGIFCLLFLLVFLIVMQMIRTRRFDLGELRKLLPGSLIAFGAYICLIAFRIIYYHDIFPNTHYAKVAWAWVNVEAWTYHVTHLALELNWLLVLIPLAFLAKEARRFSTFLLAPILFIFISSIAVGGTLGGGGYRLFIPYLPFVALLCGQGLINVVVLLQRFFRNRRWKAVLSTAIILLAAALVPQSKGAMKTFLNARSNAHGAKMFFLNKAVVPDRVLGEWLRDNIPKNFHIATDRIGRVPFYSRLYTLDMFGLTEPRIAHKPIPKTTQRFAPSEMRSVSATLKKDWDYALEVKPEIIIDILPLWPQMTIRILDDYCPTEVTLPNGRVAKFLIRRDLEGLRGLMCRELEGIEDLRLMRPDGPKPAIGTLQQR